MSAWEWFSGKKLVIGGILFLVVKFLNEVIVGGWGVDTPVMSNIIFTIEWVATAFSGIGLAHKGHKVANYDNNPPGIS